MTKLIIVTNLQSGFVVITETFLITKLYKISLDLSNKHCGYTHFLHMFLLKCIKIRVKSLQNL